MKEIFEKHKDRLSSDERQSIWAALRKESSAHEHGPRGRLGWPLGHSRRRSFWALPAFGVLATAVLVVVLLHHRGNSVPGLSLNAPTEMTGAASPSPVQSKPETQPGLTTAARPEGTARLQTSPQGAGSAEEKRTAPEKANASPAPVAQGNPPAVGPSDASTLPPSARLSVERNAAGKKTPLPPSLTKRKDEAVDLQAHAPGSAVVPPARSESEGSAPALALEGKASEVTTRSPVSSPQAMEAGPLGGSRTSLATAPPPDLASRNLGPASRSAGSGGVAGVVTDLNDAPVAYANLLIAGTSWGAFSLEDGTYKIPNIPAGTYTVQASIIGYEAQKAENVRVTAGAWAEANFKLKSRPVGSLQEVEVVARREVIQSRSASTSRQSDTKDVGPLPMITLSDIVSQQPGAVAKVKDQYSRGGRAGEGNETASVMESGAGRAPRNAPPPGRQPPVFPSTGGSTLPNDEVYDSMFFKHYGVNPFVATDEDPLSTFAVDVDAASYTVARKYIELGHLPPPEAVRVEEFVNFFPQDYPRFSRPDFRIFLEAAPSPFGKGYTLVRVGLKGREIGEEDRKPANLVFVIDVSGSMEREDRLELVKRALRILVDELTSSDRVGIVVYTTTARVLLDPVSLREREEILEAIERLHPESSTNVEDGLRLGYEMARRIERPGATNRIILCTDGVANEGMTSAESILEEVRRQADKGIQLTAIGFGMGNYNDVLLEKLADKGDGNYYYVDRLEEARRVFRENLSGTLQTIAQDAKIQVEFEPSRVLRYRLLGFENRDVADRDFRNDRVDAGEIGAGHAVTALYEIKLAEGVNYGRLATVRLRYASPGHERHGADSVVEMEESLDASDLLGRFRQASPSFRLDVAVAEFAEILRGSYWAKESSLEDVLPIARDAADDLRSREAGERAREFVELVERATGLQQTLAPEEKDRLHRRYPDEGPDQRRSPDEDRDR